MVGRTTLTPGQRGADGTTVTAPSALLVRNPQFGYGPDVDPMWTPAKPELACAANSVSLLMPFMEP